MACHKCFLYFLRSLHDYIAFYEKGNDVLFLSNKEKFTVSLFAKEFGKLL